MRHAKTRGWLRAGSPILILSLLVSFGCENSFTQPVGDQTRPVSAVVPPSTTSVISALISEPLADLQAQCNGTVPKQFDGRDPVRLHGFRNESVWYSLKREAVTLTASGSVISFEIPFTGKGGFDGNFHPVPIGGGIGVHKTADFAGRATGSVKLHVNPDWTLGTDTSISVVVDKAETVFDLPAGMKINVSFRRKAQDLINQRAPAIFKTVIDQAAAKLDLPGKAQKLWRNLHLCRKIEASPAVWLTLRPEEARISPLVAKNGSVQTTVSVKARTDGFVSSEVPTVSLTTLPHAIEDSTLDNVLEVVMPTHITAKLLEDEIRKALMGKPFNPAQGRPVRINSAALKLVGDHLELAVAGTDEDSSADGSKQFVLRGKPIFDAASQVVGLDDLATVPPGAFNGKIALGLKPFLEEATSSMKKHLVDLETSNDAKLQIKINKIELTGLQVLDSELLLIVRTSGKASVMLNSSQ